MSEQLISQGKIIDELLVIELKEPIHLYYGLMYRLIEIRPETFEFKLQVFNNEKNDWIDVGMN